jgi:hypothetical protein
MLADPPLRRGACLQPPFIFNALARVGWVRAPNFPPGEFVTNQFKISQMGIDPERKFGDCFGDGAKKESSGKILLLLLFESFSFC